MINNTRTVTAVNKYQHVIVFAIIFFLYMCDIHVGV